MKPSMHRLIQTLTAIGLATAAASSFAGRPLTVDDAGINEEGHGHVETWVARSDGATAWTISPAYAITKNVELVGAFTSVNVGGLRGTTLAAKWQLMPSKADGCNGAATLGYTHVSSDVGNGNATQLNGILSCNGMAFGNLHFNLGYAKPNGGSGETVWGVALEKEFGGVTGHIETFGSDSLDTTVQIGARGEISKGIQLDGTYGRVSGSNVYSLGLKFLF